MFELRYFGKDRAHEEGDAKLEEISAVAFLREDEYAGPGSLGEFGPLLRNQSSAPESNPSITTFVNN